MNEEWIEREYQNALERYLEEEEMSYRELTEHYPYEQTEKIYNILQTNTVPLP